MHEHVLSHLCRQIQHISEVGKYLSAGQKGPEQEIIIVELNTTS